MSASASQNPAPEPHIAALTHPDLREAFGWLAAFRSRNLDDRALAQEAKARLATLKRDAVREGHQALAKAVWCLQSAIAVHEHYLSAMAAMRAGNHYAGWCELERAEISLHFLDRHLRDPHDRIGLELIRHQIKSFQGIFPYKLFISPEIWEKEVHCTICDSRVTPRRGCDHRPGEIYDGEHCGRRITDAEFLAASLVRVPVQKYSVVYPADVGTSGGEPNPAAYPTVNYVVERLQSPWHRFHFEWTQARHSHERYADVSPTDPCPCVAPSGTYEECCGPTEGVLRPQLVVAFEHPPPPELRNTIYTY